VSTERFLIRRSEARATIATIGSRSQPVAFVRSASPSRMPVTRKVFPGVGGTRSILAHCSSTADESTANIGSLPTACDMYRFTGRKLPRRRPTDWRSLRSGKLVLIRR